MVVYGIKNCDTVKKALNWLDENKVKYEFHDFKKLSISEDKLKDWSDKVGYEALLNKKGTTWKKLDKEVQDSITSASAAFTLMQDKTSVIKRPVLEKDGKIVLGFNPDSLQELLK
ncbi:ArsC family reductase [Desertivirga xinjiangensis]|uniref:ArsC family reductase n=1 Tax=Desertivirga xinjiangensis TaxID=539206 RepID=UPI002109BCA6|nr:ArsC family reductase [Pedobacter xinjiangensis]